MASAICRRSLPPTISSELVCEPLTFRLVFVVGENVVVVWPFQLAMHVRVREFPCALQTVGVGAAVPA